MKMKPAAWDARVFEALACAARDGARCPTNDELGAGGPQAVGRLARAGRIRVEIYRQNWRVVEMLDGAAKGSRTAEHPGKGKPYRIVDAQGGRWISRPNGGGKAITRHAARVADRDTRAPVSVSLPRLRFLDGGDGQQ